MTDRRFTLVRDGLAAAKLEGLVEAERYAETRPMRCVVTAAAIRRGPDSLCEQDDQLVFGEAFDVLIEEAGFAFGQARRDGYVGWVEAAALVAGIITPTHWVRALSTFAFAGPDFKAAAMLTLPMNSLVQVIDRQGRFVRITDSDWVFDDHLEPVAVYETDPAAVAIQFEGAPYLWGGRTGAGIDCSGLVQQAHYACAMPSARDADLQARLGAAVRVAHLSRNDLAAWPGHIGIMLDSETLLHASARTMLTRAEPLAAASARTEPLGAGAPTGFRRV